MNTESKAPQEELLQVEGMTCANCAMSVERTLRKIGLEDVHVDHASGEVSFQDPSGTDPERIREAVHGLGYRVVEADEKEQGDKKGWSPLEKKFAASALFTLPLFLHMFLPASSFLQHPMLQLLLCLPVYAIGVLHFGKSAWGSVRSGVANMDVLIFIGSSAAFFYSLAGTLAYYGSPAAHDFLFFETAAMIITLVLLGNLIEQRSVASANSAVEELKAMKESVARRVVQRDGKEDIETVDADVVGIGDRLQVNDGDRIPVDGRLIQGEVQVDESMITGESEPVRKREGDKLIGGTVVLDGSMRMVAEKVGDATVLSGIIDMVKKAQREKPSIQRLGDKVSSVFVPAVILFALGTFLISWTLVGIPMVNALMNSIAVLVIACPCAMGLATPTAVAAGIGRAAKNGVLIRGGNTLETYSDLKTVVFDKTGTLTSGGFHIAAIHSENGMPEEEVRDLVYSLEQHSSHPIARALVNELKGNASLVKLSGVEERKGEGVLARSEDGKEFRLGTARFTGSEENEGAKKLLFLSKDGVLISRIEIEDELKPGAKEMVRGFQRKGVRTVMLSGDRKERCEMIARDLGIDEWHAEKLPDEKLELIEAYSKEGITAMVGDGINDAPSLARADIGVSLGGATDVAIQSAQVVLLDGQELGGLNRSLSMSQQTLVTIKQNLFWAFFYNVLAIPVAAVGLLSPMIAALSMAFSDVIVVGNSIRLKFKRID